MKTLLLCLSTLTVSSALLGADGSQWNIDRDKSSVTFLATGTPGFLKIKGEKAVLEGKIQVQTGRLQGQFEVPLDGFVTGIELRDRHMKEKHFETQRFPKASLVIDDMPWPPVGKSVPFSGRLTLKGVQKTIQGQLVPDKLDDKTIEGQADFKVKLSDYPELGVPQYLGITVAEDVAVKVKLSALRSE